MLTKLAHDIEEFDININEDELMSLMKIKRRWPFRYPWDQPSVEIINNVGNTRSPFYNEAGFDYDDWRWRYNKGFTTILSNVLDLTEELRNLDSMLNAKIGNPVNGNFYWSRTGQVASFDYHKHDYDVIVKQIYGSCMWKIDGNEFEITPGKTAYIPKETGHCVLNKPEDKLSLTINII